MNVSLLVPLSDSASSRSVVNYLSSLPICPERFDVTLLHVFIEPTGGEALMGKKFITEQPAKYLALLKDVKTQLVDCGFFPDKIRIELDTAHYSTVTDGIIECVQKNMFDMVLIGRKNKSKAEEFVLGDISIKLVRALTRTAVLVVKAT